MHRMPGAVDRLQAVDPSHVVLCAPVLAEVRFGLDRLPARARRRRLLEAELAMVREVTVFEPWTAASATRFGTIKAERESAGQRIDDFDVVIASIALELEARVATANLRHVIRVSGLEVEHWSA